jgi:hypothetical protein
LAYSYNLIRRPVYSKIYAILDDILLSSNPYGVLRELTEKGDRYFQCISLPAVDMHAPRMYNIVLFCPGRLLGRQFVSRLPRRPA